MKITLKWLADNNACLEGYHWFKRNYPKGLTITKGNVKVAVWKLLSRKKTFLGFYASREVIKHDTVFNLEWILGQISMERHSGYDYKKGLFRTETIAPRWKFLSYATIADYFWEDYKKIMKPNIP